MKKNQCERCPNCISHFSALRIFALSGTELPKEWSHARWYCTNNCLCPVGMIPKCSLSIGKKGVKRAGGKLG